jgi:nifR3 family TIM-barrel protein
MRIGHLTLPRPFSQAGLAGYSDRAMRMVARRRGCPYAVTEALLDIIMLNGGEGLRRSVELSADDHPIAGQLMGSEPDQLARAAAMLAHAGFDVVDLNFACPVKKIRARARGGHMLTVPRHANEILRAVRDAVPAHIPTTLKLRRGFDDSPAALDSFHAILQEAHRLGFAAACVHARTVEQKYQGRSHWPFLRDLKAQYPDWTLIGSGDIFTAADVVRLLRETGVDGVSIARGAIGNPWIFDHAAAILDGAAPDSLQPPTVAQQREALLEHFLLAMEVHGEQLAGRRMRKMGIRYARFHPQCEEVKRKFIEVRSLRDWQTALDQHYREERAGVWPPASSADLVNEE